MSDSENEEKLIKNTENDEKPSRNTELKTSKNVTLTFKLDGRNYPLWSRLMKVAIGGRRASSHILDEPPAPKSKGYRDWEETDLIVFSWIIENMKDELVADFAHHLTAKALWDNLAVTYESKADPYLIYDLEERAAKITQGNHDLETYYRKINSLWISIDRCQQDPISCCDKGVKQWRDHTNTRRLFRFLAGLNEEYDGIRRDILKESPLPSVEAAYGWVRREAARRKIMPPTSSSPSTVLAGEASLGDVGHGYRVLMNKSKGTTPHQPPPTRVTHKPVGKEDKSHLWCTHCGKNKHTYETCFLRVGYPEWWDEKKARPQAKLAVGTTVVNQSGGNNQGGGSVGNLRQGEGNFLETSIGAGDNEPATRSSAGNRGHKGDGGKGFGYIPNPNPNFRTPSLCDYSKLPQ